MKCLTVQWLILPVFFLCSCCPVNRLSDRNRPVKTVVYEAIVLEKPTVRFTGHRSLKIKPGVPTGTSGYIEAELEKALADVGGEDFSAMVLEQAGRLGWAQAEEGAGVVLTESGSGEVLWRDCLDWSFEGLYSSLQDLAQADAAQQKELFSELAARLVDRLAKHLATQVPKE
jgi:hypothetical protein